MQLPADLSQGLPCLKQGLCYVVPLPPKPLAICSEQYRGFLSGSRSPK